jgi:hypothetical protein
MYAYHWPIHLDWRNLMVCLYYHKASIAPNGYSFQQYHGDQF